MNSGSFFFAEMVRIMSSLSPGGTVSVSTSVTNPYAYSRLTSASIPELIPTPWRFYTSLRRFNLKQICRDSQANRCIAIPLSRSEEHTSELQSRFDLVCRLLLEKKKKK